MSDTRAIIQLFEECHKESTESLQNETRIDSPFPPFGELTYPETWRLWQNLYDGKHWSLMPKMAKWKSRPVKNICFMGVEGNTTFLTDNRPAISILPRSADDADLAELCKSAVDFWWDTHGMDRKLMDVVKLSRIFGIGWLHLYWDSEKKQHVCKVVKPWNVLVDPDATAEDYDPAYLIYQFKTTVGELQTKFKDADWTDFDPDYRPADARTFDDVMNDGERPRALHTQQSVASRPTWCYQFWLRDGEADFIEKDIGNGKVAVLKKKKYPNGRVITIAGNVVLSDKPSPYTHGEFPFVPYLAYPVPGKLVGPGDIQNIASSQVYRNRTQQIFYDALEKSMGAVYLVNRRLFKGDRLTNEPVQVHEVDDVDRAMKVVTTGSPTRHELSLLSVFDKDMDDVLGQHEFSRGEPVPGNKTAQEVSVIAESDKTRVRAAARVIGWANKKLANQLLHNMAKYTDFEWIVRVAGPDGEENLPVPFNGTMLRQEDEKGKLTEDSIGFDLRVDDYSMLPASQRDKTGLYMQLFGMIPGFPIEEFLKGLGLPNYKSIAMKIQEAQQPPPQEAMPAAPAEAAPPMDAASLMAPAPVGAGGPPPELMPMLMAMAQQMGMGGDAQMSALMPQAMQDLTGGEM